MDVAEYRAFQEGRPDTERWELIAGEPVIVPPQTILHGRMVSDMANALDAPMRAAGSGTMALQRIAVDIASTDAIEAAHGISGRCVPGPDVIVMDRAYEPGAWLAARAYLVGEVVGDPHDQRPVGNGTWLDLKIDCYMGHAPCCAIVVADQGSPGLLLYLRGDEGWSSRMLDQGDEVVIPRLGICVPVVCIRGWHPGPVPHGAPPLSGMAWAVLRRWGGRPDARLSAVADIALPLSRSTNRSVISNINELVRAGLIENSDGLRLTDAGRVLLEAEDAVQRTGAGAR